MVFDVLQSVIPRVRSALLSRKKVKQDEQGRESKSEAARRAKAESSVMWWQG